MRKRVDTNSVSRNIFQKSGVGSFVKRVGCDYLLEWVGIICQKSGVDYLL